MHESGSTLGIDAFANVKHVLLPITDRNPYLSEGTRQVLFHSLQSLIYSFITASMLAYAKYEQLFFSMEGEEQDRMVQRRKRRGEWDGG